MPVLCFETTVVSAWGLPAAKGLPTAKELP